MKWLLSERGDSSRTLFKWGWVVGLLLVLLTPLHSTHAADSSDSPQWTLPIPADETWEIIQGYNCGTHDGWGRLSFDLVNSDGRTRGAPVRAAADGEFWFWVPDSGTLLLKHPDGYFTMYTHLQSHVQPPRGTLIQRGSTIGTVGNVGAEHTVPHLHFTIFQQTKHHDERQPVALEFREGYEFPEDGSCNQYGGTTLTAPPLDALKPTQTPAMPTPVIPSFKRLLCHPSFRAFGFSCAE